MSLALVFLAAFLFGWWAYYETVSRKREASRLSGKSSGLLEEVGRYFNRLVIKFGSQRKNKQTLGYLASKSEREMTKKLVEAGLETASEQGKFLLARNFCFLAGPLLGATAYLYILPYYATIITLAMSAVGILLPMLWLRAKKSARTEDIQRELPLVLDLTNLGTSAGWDTAAALERVIDSLYPEFPKHALIRELRRARLLIINGYTWSEALKRLGQKLDDDTVKRTCLALTQAIKQGGDRTKQLEAIAEDAQRIFYAQLDKRLAALPVKALLVTMLLMIAYFIILLAPAGVQVKSMLMK